MGFGPGGPARRSREEVVRVLGRLLAVLLVVVVVAVMAAGGLLAWVGARALPQTSGNVQRAGHGLPRRGRGCTDRGGLPRRPFLRAGLCPRVGADVADGGLPPHRQRPARRAVRKEPGGYGSFHPGGRTRCRRFRSRPAPRSRTRSRRHAGPGAVSGAAPVVGLDGGGVAALLSAGACGRRRTYPGNSRISRPSATVTG